MLDPVALAHRLRAVNPDAYTFAAPSGDGARRRVARAPRVAPRPDGQVEPARGLGAALRRSGRGPRERRRAARLGEGPRGARDRGRGASPTPSGRYATTSGGTPSPCCRRPRTCGTCRRGSRGRSAAPAPDRARPRAGAAPHPGDRRDGRSWRRSPSIAALEPFERGAYAGPVGWVDAEGRRGVRDRAALRAPPRRARDPVRGRGHRRRERPRRRGRRDRAQVRLVPRRAPLGLSRAPPSGGDRPGLRA